MDCEDASWTPPLALPVSGQERRGLNSHEGRPRKPSSDGVDDITNALTLGPTVSIADIPSELNTYIDFIFLSVLLGTLGASQGLNGLFSLWFVEVCPDCSVDAGAECAGFDWIVWRNTHFSLLPFHLFMSLRRWLVKGTD